jgi:hypothetical protein
MHFDRESDCWARCCESGSRFAASPAPLLLCLRSAARTGKKVEENLGRLDRELVHEEVTARQ